MRTARSLQTRPAARPARRGVNGRAGGRFPRAIASGGQSGVDRAALDAAIDAGLDIGGWCPRGRRAEDGPIAGRHRLREAPLRDPAVRTRLNVRDADATLVLLQGPPDRGTVTTMRAARALGRPLFVVDLRAPPPPARLAARLAAVRVVVLNVAGPRESRRPGIGRAARRYLDRLFAAGGRARPLSRGSRSARGGSPRSSGR